MTFDIQLVAGDVSYLRAMLGGQGTRNLMSTSDSITEDISRIRDDLAAIVTRDLIACKVTSPRDAPRIVDIGRAIANLGKVYSRVLDLEDVVEDLAAGSTEEDAGARAEEGPQTVEELWEGLRRIEHAREVAEEQARRAEGIVADLVEYDPVSDALVEGGPRRHEIEAQCALCARPVLAVDDHSDLCPWLRAVEWVQTQEFEEDVERFAAGEELGDPMQATLTHAVDEAWAQENADAAGPEDERDRTAEQEETADWLVAAHRAWLEDLLRTRLATNTGKRYTLEEVCEILGVSLEELEGEEE